MPRKVFGGHVDVETIDGGVRLHDQQSLNTTSSGDVLELRALRGDIVRVTLVHAGSPLHPAENAMPTWMVVGEYNDVPRQGRNRNDLAHLLDSRFRVDESNMYMCTGDVQVRWTSGPGPLVLEWSTDSEACGRQAGSVFFRDGALGGYAYDHNINRPARHTVARAPDTIYLGTGESSGKINKAGRRLRVQCTDAMGYSASSSDPLYKHFPWYITIDKVSGIACGILYDNLSRGVLDFGQEISAFRGLHTYYEAANGLIDYYMIYGPTVADVLRKLSMLVGKPALPTKWSLGYVGSQMAATDALDASDRLCKFQEQLEQYSIPASGFYLSSGYTMQGGDSRCVFTWDKQRIPNPAAMFDTFHQNEMGVIPNVKPWLLTCHPDYEMLKRSGGFVSSAATNLRNHRASESNLSNQGGSELTFRVPSVDPLWKGGAGTFAGGSYIDFSTEAGCKYWQDRLSSSLFEHGADAVWNDNNEYELDDDEALVGEAQQHQLGTVGRALQTLLMGKASHAALLKHQPNKRPLVVSRSGCPGIQRYCAQTWSGDNVTNWEALKYNVAMCLSLGLSGWGASGPDVGGFAGSPVDSDLFLRWVQLGVLMPRFTIHSSSFKDMATEPTTDQTDAGIGVTSAHTGANAKGTGQDNKKTESNNADKDIKNNGDVYNLSGVNEPWMFPSILPLVRDAIQLRYRLLPLLASLHLEAYTCNAPICRPLVYHYQHLNNVDISGESFQFMLGKDILVAPITEANAQHVNVLLPDPDEQWCDLGTGIWHSGGSKRVRVDVPTDRYLGVPVFLRAGGALLLAGNEFQGRTHSSRDRRVVILGLPPAVHNSPSSSSSPLAEVDYVWMEDDGESCDYMETDTGTTSVHVHARSRGAGNEVEVTFVRKTGGYVLPFNEVSFELPVNDTRVILESCVKVADVA